MGTEATDLLRLRDTDIGWPLEALWATGDLLDTDGDLETGSVILELDVPPAELPWLAVHPAGEWVRGTAPVGQAADAVVLPALGVAAMERTTPPCGTHLDRHRWPRRRDDRRPALSSGARHCRTHQAFPAAVRCIDTPIWLAPAVGPGLGCRVRVRRIVGFAQFLEQRLQRDLVVAVPLGSADESTAGQR